MTFSDWHLFSLATVGVTTIVTQSKIFEPLRNLAEDLARPIGQLLHCSMCFGFWAGLLVGSSFIWPINNPFQWFMLGLAGSWLSWAATVTLHFLGSDNL